MKRKVTLTIIIFLIIGITLILVINNDSKIEKVEEIKTGNMVAIYLEEEKDTGKYIQSNQSKWPQGEEYAINMQKSYCEKGSLLRWNEKTKKMMVRVTGSDKCYVYFDLSAYGDKDHPHLIQTIEDLVRLSNDVNEGKTYTDEYFLLTNDLDFNDPRDYEDANRLDFEDINGINGTEPLIKELTTGSGFIPIGNSNNYFGGNFDGGNNKITNLYINNTTSEDYVAFFGSVMGNEISNLTISGNITSTKGNNIGGLIGYARHNANKKILIENYHNEINVIQKGELLNNSTGGIISYSYGADINIKNCTNSGLISNGAYVAGFIGWYFGNVTIENSINYGNIENNLGVYTGGLLGPDGGVNISVTQIKNSSNKGNVISNIEEEQDIIIGGLAAGISGSITISNSYNQGNVQNLKKEYPNLSSVIMRVGGLVGQSNGKTVIISNSYNTGELLGGNRIGGIIASVVNEKTIIDKCYNTGNLINGPKTGTWNSSIGGILGEISPGADKTTYTYILNSYNTGNLIGGNDFDTFAGLAYMNLYPSVAIYNSYNMGDFLNNGYGSAGIVSLSANGSYSDSSQIYINNVYNGSKNITAENIFGIALFDQEVYNISNTYFSNNISQGSILNDKVRTKAISFDYLNSQNFVDELNNNIESINLSEIDPLLKDYKLSKWQQGKDGYPELINE